MIRWTHLNCLWYYMQMLQVYCSRVCRVALLQQVGRYMAEM